MLHQYTAAVERALIYASCWSNGAGCDELEVQPLLVGLLAEPECRAATILARLGIDLAAVRRQWPTLTQFNTPPTEGTRRPMLSREVDISLQLARQRLVALLRPLELATEHVLLGVASADHDVAVWLRQRGLDPDKLEAEIYELYGYQPAPVWIEEPHEQEKLAEDKETRVAAAPARHAKPTATLRGCEKIGTGTSPDANFSGFTRAGSEPVPIFSQPLRILDAAANRAREGLRVVEDYVRFILDDRHLTELCKQLRHDLTDALGQIQPEHRLAARDTQTDVGTVLSTDSENSRSDLAEVLSANFSRLQESLRSLEEFGKIVNADLAAIFKQLRYSTYTLQRAVDITRASVERLTDARLYVLIDGCSSIERFEQLVRRLIDAGVDVLQLRDKQLADRELLERARLLRRLTQDTETLFVMNDRPDLAALARADGVHVGQEELSVKDARSIVGPQMLLGVSTHSIEQARQAVVDGANYIGVGPTFPSGTKQFERFPGVELLRNIAAEIRLPAFAIGGIGPNNVGEVLATGITRIAVSGAVTAATDPAQAVKQLLQRLAHDNHRGGTENTEKDSDTAEDAKDAEKMNV